MFFFRERVVNQGLGMAFGLEFSNQGRLGTDGREVTSGDSVI